MVPVPVLPREAGYVLGLPYLEYWYRVLVHRVASKTGYVPGLVLYFLLVSTGMYVAGRAGNYHPY